MITHIHTDRQTDKQTDASVYYDTISTAVYKTASELKKPDVPNRISN